MPMFAGIACLIFGNTCVMLGWFAGFPIDIVAGVINAICMFYTCINDVYLGLIF